MTEPTPAETLRAAAFQLRNPFHIPGLNVAIDPDLAHLLADWLERAAHSCWSLAAAADAVLDVADPQQAKADAVLRRGPYDAAEALAVARAILGTEPQRLAAHAARPQKRPGGVGAAQGMPGTLSGAQEGAQRLTPGEIADQLDEFIADAERRGADRAWVLGARCITGRVRLADPAAFGGGEPTAEAALAELRTRLVAQHKGAMSATAASSGDPALIHDGERMGIDVAVAELDALALRYANTPPAR